MVGIEQITRMSRVLRGLSWVFILTLPLASKLPVAAATEAPGTGSATERALAPNASETGLGPTPFFVHFGPGANFVASGVTTRRSTGQTEPFALTVPALPVGAVFVKSFLCWNYLMLGSAPSFDFITVQGNGVAGELKGTGTPDLCWLTNGRGVSYMADVSSQIIPGVSPGSVLIAGATDKPFGTDPAAKGEGMSLVVVYEKPGQPCGNAHLYCGYISTESGAVFGTAAATINFAAPWTASGCFHFFVNALDGQVVGDNFFINGANVSGYIAGTTMPNDAWTGVLGPKPNENYYDHADDCIAAYLPASAASLSFSTVKIGDCIGHSFAAVSFASDTCFSTGDVNGDGISLTVADYAALVQFVTAGGPPPTPLFQGDLSGDGFIDQADIDLYDCFFIYGMSCFPQFPVPVPCCPDTVRGACCEVDVCHIRSQVNCELRNGFYFGDATACTPTSCWGAVAGWKFEDLDGDGFRDAGEPPIGGVTITSLPMVSGVTDPVVTSPAGYWSFGPMPAGQYTIFETVPNGMAQTAPSTVFYTATVQPQMTALPGLFGNEDTCVTARQHVDTCLAGRMDNFSTGDGPELASPSTALCAKLQNCSLGPRNNCNPSIPGNCSEFDCPGIDRCFGHTFTGCWDDTCTVIHARLNLRVKAWGSLSSNDNLGLLQNGVGVWSIPLSALGNYPPGGVLDISLDLENLPPSPYHPGITNVLAALQDGDLDVLIQDDTEVDFLQLIVTICCHCVDPPPNMVAWWPLDEQVGATIVTDIVGSHNGTPSPGGQIGNFDPQLGPTPASLALPPPGGKVEDALYFWHQYDNRYVRVPGAPFQFGTVDFSIDAWVFINQYNAMDIQPIVEKMQYNGTTPLRGYRLYLVSGVLTFQVAGIVTATAQVGMANQLSLGVWHHVAIAYNRQSGSFQFVTFYIDGVPLMSGIVANVGNLSNSSDLIIGGSILGPAINYLNIAVDELEIFARKIEPSEVHSIWKAGSLGKCEPYCYCPYQGDINGDGFINVLDVVLLINRAFKGAAPVKDPLCPKERADFNADGVINVLDVMGEINYVFKGGPPPVNPCL